MSEYLPYRNFAWVDLTVKNAEIALNTPDNSKLVYYIEVDLEYIDDPRKQKDFPTAPEKITITKEKLSTQQNDTAREKKLKIGLVKKLTPHVLPKQNYVVLYYYSNLKYYIANGWELTKIHKI